MRWDEDNRFDHRLHLRGHRFWFGFFALGSSIGVSVDALCDTLAIADTIRNTLCLGPMRLPLGVTVPKHYDPSLWLGFYRRCIHGAGSWTEHGVYAPHGFFVRARHGFEKKGYVDKKRLWTRIFGCGIVR